MSQKEAGWAAGLVVAHVSLGFVVHVLQKASVRPTHDDGVAGEDHESLVELEIEGSARAGSLDGAGGGQWFGVDCVVVEELGSGGGHVDQLGEGT